MNIDFVEPTQPKIFHIHIDAKNMPRELDEYAINELGFVDTDFDGHPEGYQHFEPQRHLTLKLKTKEEFYATWTKLQEKADLLPDFVGYLEGEFIPEDAFIPYKAPVDLPVPFHITRRLLSGESTEAFRQTEIHLTMEKEHSDPALIHKLLESGLYGAYIPKRDGVFLVLTMQGFIKDIEPLYQSLHAYLSAAGGAYKCTIKEERALRYKMYGISSVDLPEIAQTITYSDSKVMDAPFQ